MAEIAGTWTTENQVEATVELRPDGTFTERHVMYGGHVLTNTGQWTLIEGRGRFLVVRTTPAYLGEDEMAPWELELKRCGKGLCLNLVDQEFWFSLERPLAPSGATTSN